MPINVVEVSTENQIQLFNHFPTVIYRNFFSAPGFPVRDDTGMWQDPLFHNVEAMPFLAIKNGRAVGRIAGCFHRSFPEKKTGFFGFFEFMNDPEVFTALLNSAASWLYSRDRVRMIGPVDLTPHQRLGVLVEGFEGRHQHGMPYNPLYYPKLYSYCGLQKETDLFAYHYDLRNHTPQRLNRIANRGGRIQGLQVREINFHHLTGEGELFSRIHNESMKDIWGFIPLTPEEGASLWDKLKGLYDPGLILVAEIKGEPAGLCIIMAPKHRTPPFGFPPQADARLAFLAVPPRYRFKGLEVVLLLECIQRARGRGITFMELSQVAEDNSMMTKIIQNFVEIRRKRVYRIYKCQEGFFY